jgi:endonuclease YncB( thermonuclease family)
MNPDGSNQTRLTNDTEYDLFLDAQPLTCTVAAVVDGDTFDCVGGRRVTMLQIDAPELGACGGDWAKAALEFIFLTPGRNVRLQYDAKRSEGGSDLAAPIWIGNDGNAYNLSIVMAYVGLAKAATVGTGNTRLLTWTTASQGWAQAAQWNMWAPGKTYNGGC